VAVQEQNDFERNASELKSTAEMCGECCLKQWGALLIDDQHESFGHVHCFHHVIPRKVYIISRYKLFA